MDPTVNLRREAWTLVSFTLAAISASIMVSMWFEKDINDLWIALLPIMIVTFISLIFCVYSKIWNHKEGKNILDHELVFYTSILPLSVTSSIKAYDSDIMPTFVLYLLIVKFLVLRWVIEERKNCVGGKDEEGYSKI
jgi:amino acid transporter